LQRLGAAPAEPGEAPAPSPTALSEIRFVGREGELEALRRAVETVRGGSARGVLVHGASGGGQSGLARHFVELHGGTISAASEGEGRGSTFTVALPGISATTTKQPSPQS
jgi:signal transduction histidine kinase